ncbi:MAG: hypothetical protein LBR17_05640 [Bacteroidales bacterium]|jgi:hypothetical protein|nr:hypothetical protein [Bacteroidales bacterium]
MAKLDEGTIIKNIKYNLVHDWREGKVEKWHVDDVLSMIAAMIYPFVDNLSGFDDADAIKKRGTLGNIHKAIKSFLKKKSLSDYTYEGLILYFKNEWIPTLKDKFTLVKDISLIDKVESDGYLSLKGNDAVYDWIENNGFESVNAKYGTLTYEPTNDTKLQKSKDKKETSPSNKIDNQALKAINEKLNAFWRTKIFNDTYKEVMPLVWKLKLSKSIYLDLQQLLKEAITEWTQQQQRLSKFLEQHAPKLLVYTALWYHWEYNGNDGKDAFKEIGYTGTGIAEDIWKNCPKEYEKYIYKSVSNRRWDDSMNVLGGFPLKYIANDDKRFDKLFKEIWKIQQGNSEDKTIIDIADSFDENNDVYVQSLKSGSWKEVIENILNNKLFISTDDENDGLVKKYKELIEEGKRTYYENFFEPELLFYTYGETDECACEFQVQIGNKNANCYIPYECVKQWDNIIANDSTLTEFVLGLEEAGVNNDDIKWRRKTVRFSKCGGTDSSFVGWGDTCTISVDITNLDLSTKIDLKLYKMDDNDNGVKIKSFPIKEGYFKLYDTNRPYQWSTAKDSSARQAILFSPDKFYLKEKEKSIEKIIGDGKWKWHYLNGTVTLHDAENNKDITIYDEREKLDFKWKELTNKIRNCGECQYYDNGPEKPLRLLIGYDGIKKAILHPSNKDATEKTYKKEDIRIEYKCGGRYEQLTKTKYPNTGKQKIIVKVNNLRPEPPFDCFFISEKDFIKRDLDNKEIIIKVGENASVFVKNGAGKPILLQPNDKSEYVYNDNDYPIEEDVIPFLIGSEQEYVEIEVYRARKSKEIFLDNKLIKTYDDSNTLVEIPNILHNEFEIRTINEEGVKREKTGQSIWFDHEFSLSNKTLDKEKNQITDTEAGIKFYLYANRFKEGQSGLDIGKIGTDQYRFFYWNPQSNAEPIELQTKYISEKEELDIIYKIYENGIIFQSLDGVCPRHYLMPIYTKRPDSIQISWKLLTNPVYNDTIRVKCFEIASKHKIYFHQFYPLYRLGETPEKMMEFLKAVFEKKVTLRQEDYENLHRFAHEYLFDWMLLPVKYWKKNFRDQERNMVKELFCSSPFAKTDEDKYWLKMIVKNYFALPPTNDWVFKKRSQDTVNLFAQCMRNQDRDKKMLPKSEDNKDILKKIYGSETICRDIYTFLINNQIINNI